MRVAHKPPEHYPGNHHSTYQGKGWTEYKFQNPATGKVEQKVAYAERVGDVVVLCGAYKAM